MAEAVTTVLPPQLLERTHNLSLVARRIVEGALHGMHRSPAHGLSVEFAQHREYAPGDDLKHLDWRVIGRSERYVIKQYEQETNLRALVVIDRSASMNYNINRGEQQTKFAYARRLAAALSHIMLSQGDSVGLMTMSDDVVDHVPPRAAPSQLYAICRMLVETQPNDRATDLPAALGTLATTLKRRSLIVLVSDLFNDPDQLNFVLGQLHHRGHEVVVFQVLDTLEMKFNVFKSSHGITVMRDMESGAEFDAEPHLVQHMVQAEINAFFEALDTGAKRHGYDLVRTAIDRPVEDVVVEYVHQRAARHR